LSKGTEAESVEMTKVVVIGLPRSLGLLEKLTMGTEAGIQYPLTIVGILPTL